VGPRNGFSFSLNKEGSFKDSLILNNLNSSFSSTVYVKFNPQVAASFSVGIPFTGGGLPATVIPVIAYAVKLAPY
jgi:hypothetical protein